MIRLEIAPIEGSDLNSVLTDDDRLFIATLSADRRRREVVAWRSLLRQMLTGMGSRDSVANLCYNDLGAPYLLNSDLNISVSHSLYYVAVVVSSTRCAVDIEYLERDFERVATRYSTPQEREALCRDGVESNYILPLIWSAKEALYKLLGRVGVDFIADLHIIGADTEAQQLVAEVKGKKNVVLSYQITQNHVVVYVCR